MSLHQNLIDKYRGKPWLLFLAAAGFTASFYISYSQLYKPWSRRKRLREAEEFADFVFKKENEGRNSY